MDTNTTDKFITIIDHTTASGLMYTYLANGGRNKMEAATRAALTGYSLDDVYRVILARKVEKDMYQSVVHIGPDGSTCDIADEFWNVTPDMIQH